MLSLTTSNYTPNMMKITKHKCKYLLCNQPLFQSSLKKDKLLVVMSLKTSVGFLKGQLAQNDRVDSNLRDTCKMFNTIMKIEYT